MAFPLIALKAAAWVGSKLLGFAAKSSDNAVERHRIDANLSADRLKANAAVIQSAQGYKWFWIPWLLAAVPVSAWFGWGVLDSLANGALPDVAELPPQLKQYADIVWSNIFYSGAAVGSVQIAARTAAGIFGRR